MRNRWLFGLGTVLLLGCGGGRECPEGWLEGVDGEPCMPTEAHRRDVEERLGTGLFGMSSLLCGDDGDDTSGYSESPGELARDHTFEVTQVTEDGDGTSTRHRTSAGGTWEIALPPGDFRFSERAYARVRAVDGSVATEPPATIIGLDDGEVAFVELGFPGRCD